MSIESKKQELLEELGFFHDWTERYEYVIGLGKKLKPFPVGEADGRSGSSKDANLKCG